MSINITVHGNPMSLNKENNCFRDFDFAKRTEIERRKKLRLEQVRQQSKDIASNIRNRYETGKQNEIKRIEKVKTAELRNWNAKKIVKLQNDYRNCLASVGEAHELAAQERENDKFIKEKKFHNAIMASRRGQEAAMKLKKSNETNRKNMVKFKKKVNSVATQKDLTSEESGISDIENVPDNNAKKKQRSDSLKNLLEEINQESDSESSTPAKVTKLKKKASSLVDISSSSMESNHSTKQLFYNPQNYADDSSETVISEDKPKSMPFTQISELLNFKKQRTDFGKFNQTKKSPVVIPANPIDHLTINKVHSENIPPQMRKPSLKVGVPKSYSSYAIKPQESIQSSNRFQFSHQDYNPTANDIENNSKLRSTAALDRQQVRKDYDLLQNQLEALSKEERQVKSRLPPQQISATEIRRNYEKKESKLNSAFEKILHKPVLITCPVIKTTSSTLNQKEKPSDLNVAFSGIKSTENQQNLNSSDSCCSILLGYVNDQSNVVSNDIKKCSLDDSLNNFVKVEKLKDLLRRINHQKSLLLNELEDSSNSSKSLDNVMKTVKELEKERNQIYEKNDFMEKRSLEMEKKFLETREEELKEREENLERKIKEMKFKDIQKVKNVVIETKRLEAEHDTSSESNCGPVQIIIKVNDKNRKSPRKRSSLIDLNYRRKKNYIEKLTKSPKKSFPKTPAKSNTPVERETILTKTPESSIATTSTSTNYRSPPNFLSTPMTLLFKPSFSQPVPDPIPVKVASPAPEVPKTVPQTKKLEPSLSHYINRLLGMSRNSIDKLRVSSSSEIPTPTDSVINVSGNVSSSEPYSVDESRLEKLQKFIDENYSFLSEMEETIKNQSISGSDDKSMKEVEKIWLNKLEIKENEMKLKKTIEKKKIPAPATKKQTAPVTKKPLPKRSDEKPIPAKKPLPKKSDEKPLKPALKTKPVTEPKKMVTQPPKIAEPKKIEIQTPKIIESSQTTTTEESGKNEDGGDMIKRYNKLTENCNQRISDLAELINKVRSEKLRLLENSLSSSERGQNSTEYMDLPLALRGANQSPDDSSRLSDLHTEEAAKRLSSARQIGISKDSGISVSRPVTSSDYRDSPDTIEFTPILKDIPKYQTKLPEIKLNDENLTQQEVDLQTWKMQFQQKKSKPPTSINRYSPQLDPTPIHELSTIAEVETPATSRINASIIDDKSGAVDMKVTVKDFLNITELENLEYKQFPSPKEFNNEIDLTNLEKSNSSSSSSLPDVMAELKKRNIITESYGYFGDENDQLSSSESNVNSLMKLIEKTSSESPDVKEMDNTPSYSEAMILKSPKKKQAISRRGFVTPPHEDRILENTSPTKLKQVATVRKAAEKSNKNESFSGIGILHSSNSDGTSNNLEDDLNKIGMNWASTMLKKTHEARTQLSSSSCSPPNHEKSRRRILRKKTSFVDSEIGKKDEENSFVGDQTTTEGIPLNLKEFLANELLKRNNTTDPNFSSTDSSITSQFLRSLLNQTPGQMTQSHGSRDKIVAQRTSTPVGLSSSSSGSKILSLNGTSGLFSNESRMSSVRFSPSSSGAEAGKSSSSSNSIQKSDELVVPNLQLDVNKYRDQSSN